MQTRLLIPYCALIVGFMTACSVVSQQIRSESESPVPFKTLINEVTKYQGKTVILGGYILETKNLESETSLKVLQVPLRIGEEPDFKDRSQGRFIVYYNGFLDPEVYAKNQAVTVAGRVIGTVFEKIGDNHIQYLKIENREIYLWPEYKTPPPPYHPWPYPYRWYRYPYDRYPFWYW